MTNAPKPKTHPVGSPEPRVQRVGSANAATDSTPPSSGSTYGDPQRRALGNGIDGMPKRDAHSKAHEERASEEPGARAPIAKNALADVATLRSRARENVEGGAVTAAYAADRERVLQLLNDALATELVCVLRYKRHYYMASGIHSRSVAAEFLEHAAEEQAHADLLAERIVQLGGEPNLDPDQLSGRSHAQYIEGKDLLDMIREDLVAERIAIDSYAELIRYLGDDDPTTRRMLEGILAVEEEHAEDLISLLGDQGS